MADPQGFEPQSSESESDVLPLHHGSFGWRAGIRTPIHRVKVCCPAFRRLASSFLLTEDTLPTFRILLIAGSGTSN